MKRVRNVLLSLLLLFSLCSVTAFAAEENDISKFELPAPKAPNYFVYLRISSLVWISLQKQAQQKCLLKSKTL